MKPNLDALSPAEIGRAVELTRRLVHEVAEDLHHTCDPDKLTHSDACKVCVAEELRYVVGRIPNEAAHGDQILVTFDDLEALGARFDAGRELLDRRAWTRFALLQLTLGAILVVLVFLFVELDDRVLWRFPTKAETDAATFDVLRDLRGPEVPR